MPRTAVDPVPQVDCSEEAALFDRRPFKSLEELHETTLEYFKMMWHRELGVLAAAQYCAKNKVSVPQWVVERTPSLLATLLNGRSGKRGRASNPVARYRQDMIDHARWSAVKEIRDKQTEISHHLSELRAMSKVPAHVTKETEKMLTWVGENLEQAYRCAAMLLRGTLAFAGPEAVKQSYLRVEKSSRDPQQMLR
jgi:hypothetical protein